MREKIILLILILMSIPIFVIAQDSQSLSLSIPVIINDSNTITDVAQIYGINPIYLTKKLSQEIDAHVSEDDSLNFLYTSYNLEPSKITEIAQNLKLNSDKYSNLNLFIILTLILFVFSAIIIFYIIKKK
jgi:hypothetical protein